jgi:hypothetical protein
MKPKYLSINVRRQMKNSTACEVLRYNRASDWSCFVPQRGSATPIQSRIAFSRLPPSGPGVRCRLRMPARATTALMPKRARPKCGNHLLLSAAGVAPNQHLAVVGVVNGQTRLAVFMRGTASHPAAAGLAAPESVCEGFSGHRRVPHGLQWRASDRASSARYSMSWLGPSEP